MAKRTCDPINPRFWFLTCWILLVIFIPIRQSPRDFYNDKAISFPVEDVVIPLVNDADATTAAAATAVQETASIGARPITTVDFDLIEKLSKVYSPWPTTTSPSAGTIIATNNNNNNNKYSWCSHAVRNTSQHSGLLYVKNHKAASSTAAGITLRIAHTVALRNTGGTFSGQQQIPCPHQFRHAYAIRKHHADRSIDQSFLWTTVRHPVPTALSAFFFFSASRSDLEPTSERIIRSLQQYKSRQVHLLAVAEPPPSPSTFVHHTRNRTTSTMMLAAPPLFHHHWMERHVIAPYNFMAVVERLPESLVVLKYLLHLKWSDLIVLPAKQSGGTWFLRSSYCVPLISPFTTPQVDDYIHTEFVKDNLDYWLYAVANRSLDRTIDNLGRQRVQDGVQYLNQLQHWVESKCLHEARFPCSPNGTEQLIASWKSCYAEDCGCGYACVDRLLI